VESELLGARRQFEVRGLSCGRWWGGCGNFSCESVIHLDGGGGERGLDGNTWLIAGVWQEQVVREGCDAGGDGCAASWGVGSCEGASAAPWGSRREKALRVEGGVEIALLLVCAEQR
jgi:hypothetical protein